MELNAFEEFLKVWYTEEGNNLVSPDRSESLALKLSCQTK